jgi:nitroreductase
MTMRTKLVASEKPGGLPVPYGAESIDAFLEVLQGRRSIRTGFLRDKPVPDEVIEKILEAARWAPSAGNSQPWEFLVMRSLEIREKIVEIFKTQMRDKIEIEEATRGQRRRVNAGVERKWKTGGLLPILRCAGLTGSRRLFQDDQGVRRDPYTKKSQSQRAEPKKIFNKRDSIWHASE